MQTDVKNADSQRRSLIKGMLFFLFITSAMVTVRYTTIGEYLTPTQVQGLTAAAGYWAPLAFILLYAVGICLFVPGTLLPSALSRGSSTSGWGR